MIKMSLEQLEIFLFTRNPMQEFFRQTELFVYFILSLLCPFGLEGGGNWDIFQ